MVSQKASVAPLCGLVVYWYCDHNSSRQENQPSDDGIVFCKNSSYSSSIVAPQSHCRESETPVIELGQHWER